MADLYMDDKETFDFKYHQRSVIESVFAVPKNLVGKLCFLIILNHA